MSETPTRAKKAAASGNLAILTKIDKLRELTGSRVSLPQLVVVGDQSSGKSSVLEGITGFAFPRAAELCTRYATQITCSREPQQSVAVSIIPHDDAEPSERDRLKKFHQSVVEVTAENLADIFRQANEALGIASTKGTGPAFSEHMLKIEICGPDQEHFTVIDVPGIFRRETEGLTTEEDIDLVRRLVINSMKDPRTIILAIIPSNVDPATQEILKLAKRYDHDMSRTMGVLTKPDLNIERATQQIAIDHVSGKRRDLNLGYYIVKNRGSDDANMTLQEGQAKERAFFTQEPWSVLRHTNRTGIEALKAQVRELLVGLVKRNFPQLRVDVTKELDDMRKQRKVMGSARVSADAQRAYLGAICDRFQSAARDALDANYSNNDLFLEREDLRLITNVVQANETFSKTIWKQGHTRDFAGHAAPSPDVGLFGLRCATLNLGQEYQELQGIINFADKQETLEKNNSESDGKLGSKKSSGHEAGEGIMQYIKREYNKSRGADLGTFAPSFVAAMFKEQSKKWEQLTLAYVSDVIVLVHYFIDQVLRRICPDDRVREELWNNHLTEKLQVSYQRAMSHAKFVLEVERGPRPYTLNHYFNDNLQKAQNSRVTSQLKNVGKNTYYADNHAETCLTFTQKQLDGLSMNMANSEQTVEYIHDILRSYYQVARKRFVDVVCQQAVDHYLLLGESSPLRILKTEFVMGLNEEELDVIAGEDALVRCQREKLDNDIANYEKALKVLRGSA